MVVDLRLEERRERWLKLGFNKILLMTSSKLGEIIYNFKAQERLVYFLEGGRICIKHKRQGRLL